MAILTKEQLLERVKESRNKNGFVDVVQLARSLDISVIGVADNGVENARISYNKGNNTYSLYVNQNHPPARQRFSVAHELAHYILHNDELKKVGTLSRAGSSVLEKEADMLAADILMPQEAVDDFLKNLHIETDEIDLGIIRRLAKQFRVSKEVVILRLREFGYYVPYISFS